MKKTSLIKRLGLGLATVAAATPLVFVATGCSKASAITANYVSYKDFYETRDLSKMTSGNYSHDEILLGSKRFCNGNYVLFVGSNAFPATDNSSLRFFGGPSCSSRKVEKWLSSDYDGFLYQSVWYNEVLNFNLLKDKFDVDDFGFVTFIDNFDFKFYDKTGHEISISKDASLPLGNVQNIGPFDKWTKDIIQQTKRYNKEVLDYEWDDESVSENDYIRQDAQAKAYRAFCQRGADLFPSVKPEPEPEPENEEEEGSKTFDVADNNQTSLMVVYRDGRMKEIIDLPKTFNTNPDIEDKEVTTLFGAVNKYFTPEEEEK